MSRSDRAAAMILRLLNARKKGKGHMDENLKKMLLDSDYQNTAELNLDTYHRTLPRPVTEIEPEQQDSLSAVLNRRVIPNEFDLDDYLGVNKEQPETKMHPDRVVMEEISIAEPAQKTQRKEDAAQKRTELSPQSDRPSVDTAEEDKTGRKKKQGNLFLGLIKAIATVLILGAIAFGIYKYVPVNIFFQDKVISAEDTATVENYANWNPNDTSLYQSSTSAEIQQKYESRETFVFFVGESDDAYSQELVPIINDIARRNAFDSIAYIDRENFEKKDLDSISNVVDMYKSPSYSGDTAIRIPSVVFVKNGETVYVHYGTLPGYDPLERTMTEAESDELYKVLESAFLVISGKADTLYQADEAKFLSEPDPELEHDEDATETLSQEEIPDGEHSEWVDSESIQEDGQPEYYEEPVQTW